MENNSYEVQQAVNTALEEQKKKKKKKRLIIIAVIVGIIVIGAVIGSSGDDKTTSSENNTQVTVTDEGSSEVKATSADSKENENVIGDYECVVKDAEICKNWEGKDAVKITYTFTNNNDEAESFDIALSDEVYQDGVQLESSFISSDDDDWGIDVKIKPGMSKDVSKVYLLRDKTTDLEVEISELISFNDDKLVTTVKLK